MFLVWRVPAEHEADGVFVMNIVMTNIKKIIKKETRKKEKTEEKEICILRETLDFILSACMSTHPNEFVGLLTTDKGARNLISDVIILPGTHSSAFSAYLREDMIPLGMRFIGTVHSHPHPHASHPSARDMHVFARFGKCHIITFFPYCERCWKCYNASGREISLKVI